jgi:hypothetical protein
MMVKMVNQKRPQRLYHFTCVDGHALISQSGVLLPHEHLLMRHLGPLLWLTDLPHPTPESVGLTHDWVACDRLAYRYTVSPAVAHAATPWAELRKRVPRAVVATLESYGDPAHWWVIQRSLRASEFTLDAGYKRVAKEMVS